MEAKKLIENAFIPYALEIVTREEHDLIVAALTLAETQGDMKTMKAAHAALKVVRSVGNDPKPPRFGVDEYESENY